MARDIERRLRALEGNAMQTNSQACMTLGQWHTYYATGELPDTPAARQWHEELQQRQHQVAETMAIFEDDFSTQQLGA